MAHPLAAAPPEFGEDMKRGQQRMEAEDIDGAIVHYESALARIDATVEPAAAANALPFLITARLEAHRRTGDVDQLRAAQSTIQRLLGQIESIEDKPAAAQALHDVAKKQLARVDAVLADATRDSDDTSDERDAPAASPPPPAHIDEAPPATSDVPTRAPADRARIALLASGATALTLGAGGIAAMIAGLSIGAAKRNQGRDRVDDGAAAAELVDVTNDGYRSNTLAIVGGVVGGVLVATGTVLVILGARRSRRVAFAPGSNRRAFGLATVLRF